MVRQERAVRTRRKILLAAAEVFDEVGYEATTISEILKRSGVTKGALYFHFTSKEQLAEEFLASHLAALPAVPEQDLVLQGAVDTTLLLASLLSSGDPLVRGSVRLTVEQGGKHDGLDRRAPMQAWIDRNIAVLGEAKAAGELLPHVDVLAAARLFAGSFTGVQVLSKIMTDHEDLVERVVELMTHLMASLVVPAVLVRLEISVDRARRVHEQAVLRPQGVEERELADTG